MVTVGVFVRAEIEEIDQVAGRLQALESVSTFELEDPGGIGVLLEGLDADEAYLKLTGEVMAVEGVLAAWPIHTELGMEQRGTDATKLVGAARECN